MTGEIVGPVPRPPGVVAFYGGNPGLDGWGPTGHVAYTPPRDTLDPRYAACRDHRVACDCREAMFAEDRAEWRAEGKLISETFDRILAGHRVRTYDDTAPCQCTGCQIARAASIYVRTADRTRSSAAPF